jgi:NAD(P)-dependent dehydrogenase (short-subunit alcohol dehydrogenase family)
MSFENKEALIIGGSSGMGLEAARLLVNAGAAVTLIGRRKEKLEQARETSSRQSTHPAMRSIPTR